MFNILDKNFLSDPRYFQIFTLSVLLSMQAFATDFAPQITVVAVVLGSSLLAQYLFSWVFNVKFDFRSPLITGLSLTILLKASLLLIYPVAVIVAIGSKFLIRVDNKHIFNPANIGIVLSLLIFPNNVWVSPGQWGNALWFGLLLGGLAMLVLYKIPRRDMVFLFLGSWVSVLLIRTLWLGDPLSIMFHQLQSGAFLIFCFFMISDPKTIPDRMMGRLIFALAVSALAYILTFELRIRESLFYALALVCVMRPLIDHCYKGLPFHWITERTKS